MELHSDFDCIHLCFAKAFDRVSHHKLINKIYNISIQGNLLLWISNLLSHRRQRVMCNGVCSNWYEVTSGIPQGSVLGPLLFTIFINNLPLSIITSHIHIFADDLDKRVLWSKKWLLPFNIDKCNILHFGKNNPNIEMDKKTYFSKSHNKGLGCNI